jgi:diguanylate cyclase
VQWGFAVEPPALVKPTAADTLLIPMNKPWFSSFLDMLLSIDERKRIRLQHWGLGVIIYVLGLLCLASGVNFGWINSTAYLILVLGAFTGLTLLYVLIRSGWSERWPDPGLTTVQLAFHLTAVLCAYYIAGPVRSAFLLPLPLILTFASFSSQWRKIGTVILACIVCLGATIFLLYLHRPEVFNRALDFANLAAVCIVLPACLWTEKRITSLKARLQQKSSELGQALSEVQRLGTRDELTGLPNRRQMQEVMNLEYQRCVRSGHVFCIAVIDLDHFNQVNTQHGRPAGDEVLRQFAQQALLVIRISDVLARWGGEEFLLIMSDTRAPLARLGLERLRERIESLDMKVNGVTLKISMSAGVVEHLPGENVANAIARADTALYLAKAQGRNRIVVG